MGSGDNLYTLNYMSDDDIMHLKLLAGNMDKDTANLIYESYSNEKDLPDFSNSILDVLEVTEVTDSAIRRLLVQAGDEIDDLLLLCRAAITSGNPTRVKKHLANFDQVVERMKEVEEKDQMRAFQSPVRGDEIMQVCQLEPGPLVGKIKKRIEEAILDGHIPNEHDAALQYLLSFREEFIKIIKSDISDKSD